MKRINERELRQLAELEPEGLLKLRLITDMSYKHKSIGFNINGRLLADGRYIKYAERIVSWSDLFSIPRCNVWDYIAQTEDNCTITASVDSGIDLFIHETKRIAAYAVTEQEFNECVPVMKGGEYVFFVERREKADFKKEEK